MSTAKVGSDSNVEGGTTSMRDAFDAVIVGAGLAGSVAALRAQELGSRTLLVDKSTQPSADGNTVLSGGNLHLAYSHLTTPTDLLRERIRAHTRGAEISSELVEALLAGRHVTLDWLMAHRVEFQSDPDSTWRLWLAPYRPLRDVHSWQDRGPDRALRLLRQQFASLGGTIAGGATAVELVPGADNGITGIVIKKDGSTRLVSTPNVVLADGGFQASSELVDRYIGTSADRIRLRAGPTGTGDGLIMAEPFNPQLVNLQYFYGHLLHRACLEDDRLWPYPELDPLLAHGVLVAGSGHRFADEGRGGVAMTNATARLDNPSSAWIVTDDVGWATLRPASTAREVLYADRISYFNRCGAPVFEAPTIRELAERTGLSPDVLTSTVDTVNSAYDAGTLDRCEIPRTGLARAVRQQPFHAVPIVPGITFTMGGLLTDGEARVLDTDGRAIPGLFAARA